MAEVRLDLALDLEELAEAIAMGFAYTEIYELVEAIDTSLQDSVFTMRLKDVVGALPEAKEDDYAA